MKHGDFKIWYGEDESAAKFLVEISNLKKFKPQIEKIHGTGKEFVDNPDAIQQILYLDQPDIIVTYGYPEQPILGVEFCGEAPTGHDVFQRTARVAAAAEFGTPFAFVFPERKWVERISRGGWDHYNPLPLKALIEISRFHNSPILGFFWTADKDAGAASNGYLICDDKYPNLPSREDPEMQDLVQFVDLVISYVEANQSFRDMVFAPFYTRREAWMWEKYYERVKLKQEWSPLTACKSIPTTEVVKYIKKHTGIKPLQFPSHLEARAETIIYTPGTKTFRADPYAGNLVGIDYLLCRTGPTIRHRHRNLILHLENVEFQQAAQKFESYHQWRCPMRPGYGSPDSYLTLHLKDGCRYTKQKELRTFCFLADVIIFKDSVLY